MISKMTYKRIIWIMKIIWTLSTGLDSKKLWGMTCALTLHTSRTAPQIARLSFRVTWFRGCMLLLSGTLRAWETCWTCIKTLQLSTMRQGSKLCSITVPTSSFVSLYTLHVWFYRCNAKPCQSAPDERISQIALTIYLRWISVLHWEKTRDLYRFSDHCADLLHRLLAAILKRTKLPDLQDQAHAYDHTLGALAQDQKRCESLIEPIFHSVNTKERFL